MMTVANDAPTSLPDRGAGDFSAAVDSRRRRSGDGLIAVALGVVTVLVFIRAAGFDFLNFDDWGYVKGNLHVLTGWSVENFRWAFTTFHLSNYHPLTWLGYQSIAQIFGRGPAGFHVVIVLLHAINAALLFLLLVDLTGARWRSGLVAALFAVHPLRLESVAWISEFKDVLCGMFFLLTLLAYGRYVRSRIRGHALGWYVAACALLVLGLLAKPMLVTLPCVLLLMDFWPLKRSVRWSRLLLEKVPFGLIAAGSCVVTYIAQRVGGAMGSTRGYPPAVRIGNALYAYGQYLRKTFWPTDLVIFYPYHGVVPHTTFPWSAAIVSGIVLLLITAGAIWLWRRERAVLVGWLWFLGMLVPTIGLVQVGSQAMADRYTYLPQIGLLIAIVWGGAWVLRRRGERAVRAGAAIAGAAIVALAVSTSIQLSHWRDSQTIFSHALDVTDHNAIAAASLGRYYQFHGDSAQAMTWFVRAYRIDPMAPAVETYIGGLIRDQGRPREALPHLEHAVRLNPKDADGHHNLANTLADLGRYDEAIRHFEQSVELDPSQAKAWFNYGITLATIGRTAEAASKFQRALALTPDDANVHYVYALALEQLNQPAQAVGEFERAMRLRPDWAEPAAALAWLLATTPDRSVRDPARAVALGEALNQATVFGNADFLDKLAAAYASAGRFDQAVSTARRAGQLARSSGQTALAAQIVGRLALYQTGKPYIVPVHPATTSPAHSTMR